MQRQMWDLSLSPSLFITLRPILSIFHFASFSAAPLDAPRITNLVSQSPTTILVEWREVIFPAGEIVSYELTLDFPSLTKFTALPSARSHRFFDLSPNQVYNVTVAATNSDGTGPLSFETVTTLEEPTG